MKDKKLLLAVQDNLKELRFSMPKLGRQTAIYVPGSALWKPTINNENDRSRYEAFNKGPEIRSKL